MFLVFFTTIKIYVKESFYSCPLLLGITKENLQSVLEFGESVRKVKLFVEVCQKRRGLPLYEERLSDNVSKKHGSAATKTACIRKKRA